MCILSIYCFHLYIVIWTVYLCAYGMQQLLKFKCLKNNAYNIKYFYFSEKDTLYFYIFCPFLCLALLHSAHNSFHNILSLAVFTCSKKKNINTSLFYIRFHLSDSFSVEVKYVCIKNYSNSFSFKNAPCLNHIVICVAGNAYEIS